MKKIQEDGMLSYIETQLDKNCTIKEIAEAFGYSQDHFRHLFRMYYDMPLGAYIRRRRLIKAAQKIQEGESVTSAALAYGFDTAAGFSKAFRKEFGFSANEFKTKGQMLEDVIPDPVYDKNQILISFMETPELKMVGKPLLPEERHAFDLLEEAAYWLDHDLPKLTEEELEQVGGYKNDSIAMWYHPVENTDITYLLGPVVRSHDRVPEGMIPVTIPGRRYAVFEMKRQSHGKELAEDVRQLCKYIFWEWVPANGVITDKMGFTFERYQGNKAAVYLPLIPQETK